VFAVTDVASLWNQINLANPPAIVLVDFWLSNGASLSLLNELKADYPQIPLLVISADDNDVVENKVRSAGVCGFLNKQAAPEVFVQAVAAILRGETWFSSLQPRHSDTYQPNELSITAKELGLTKRQGEILSMIIQGSPNKLIAKELNLSEQTVKEHVSGILSRLGVNNRIEAITKLRGKRLD
jgi:DNA-binding NarL/FixJ family response regulator